MPEADIAEALPLTIAPDVETLPVALNKAAPVIVSPVTAVVDSGSSLMALKPNILLLYKSSRDFIDLILYSKKSSSFVKAVGPDLSVLLLYLNKKYPRSDALTNL